MNANQKGFTSLIIIAVVFVLGLSSLAYWKMYHKPARPDQPSTQKLESVNQPNKEPEKEIKLPRVEVLSNGAFQLGSNVKASAELSVSSAGICKFSFNTSPTQSVQVQKEIRIVNSSQCEITIPTSEFKPGLWKMDMFFMSDDSQFESGQAKFFQIK